MQQAADTAISRDELARVLDLQARAYETLMWLSNIAHSRPEMLTERTADALRDPAACRAWLGRFHEQLPARLRPQGEEAGPFSLLFAGFFQTSFRIERRLHDGRPYHVIALNKDEAAGKGKLGTRPVPRALKRKRNDQAKHLLYRSLTALNDGPEDAAFWAAADEVLGDAGLRDDYLAWAYACELVHRARGEVHGPAVHTIWKQMRRDERQHLTPGRVWRARERVAAALHAAATRARAAPRHWSPS